MMATEPNLYLLNGQLRQLKARNLVSEHKNPIPPKSQFNALTVDESVPNLLDKAKWIRLNGKIVPRRPWSDISTPIPEYRKFYLDKKDVFGPTTIEQNDNLLRARNLNQFLNTASSVALNKSKIDLKDISEDDVQLVQNTVNSAQQKYLKNPTNAELLRLFNDASSALKRIKALRVEQQGDNDDSNVIVEASEVLPEGENKFDNYVITYDVIPKSNDDYNGQFIVFEDGTKIDDTKTTLTYQDINKRVKVVYEPFGYKNTKKFYKARIQYKNNVQKRTSAFLGINITNISPPDQAKITTNSIRFSDIQFNSQETRQKFIDGIEEKEKETRRARRARRAPAPVRVESDAATEDQFDPDEIDAIVGEALQ
jgi:hypothetical protein